MRTRARRVAVAVSAASALAVLLSGCGSVDDWSGPRADLGSISPLPTGFTDSAAPPTPGAMITPRAGSWEAVHPPVGYRVVLLTAGDDPATTTLVSAVTQWAADEEVSLRTVSVDRPDRAIDGIVEAMELEPDLIVSAGAELVDPLAVVTASHLDRQFLVVGAQLPEPTINVTAAVWQGASTRGSALPNSPSADDREAFTSERATAATRAGVASVLSELTGIVIWID